MSPGWVDLHAHVWHGGTDISIRPQLCGIERGVTTIVDAGSAGEANFHGFREYVIEPAARAHQGLPQHRLDRARGLQPRQRADRHALDRHRPHHRLRRGQPRRHHRHQGARQRRDPRARGASRRCKIAKKVARSLKLPLMVHVGEPPPISTRSSRCSTPATSSPTASTARRAATSCEDEDLFAAGRALRQRRGYASTSATAARPSRSRSPRWRSRAGCCPFSISTDLHHRSLDNPVWDMGTTMSKLLAVGMPFEEVIDGVDAARR